MLFDKLQRSGPCYVPLGAGGAGVQQGSARPRLDQVLGRAKAILSADSCRGAVGGMQRTACCHHTMVWTAGLLQQQQQQHWKQQQQQQQHLHLPLLEVDKVPDSSVSHIQPAKETGSCHSTNDISSSSSSSSSSSLHGVLGRLPPSSPTAAASARKPAAAAAAAVQVRADADAVTESSEAPAACCQQCRLCWGRQQLAGSVALPDARQTSSAWALKEEAVPAAVTDAASAASAAAAARMAGLAAKPAETSAPPAAAVAWFLWGPQSQQRRQHYSAAAAAAAATCDCVGCRCSAAQLSAVVLPSWH